jgi:hypothetical protein
MEEAIRAQIVANAHGPPSTASTAGQVGIAPTLGYPVKQPLHRGNGVRRRLGFNVNAVTDKEAAPWIAVIRSAHRRGQEALVGLQRVALAKHLSWSIRSAEFRKILSPC